MEHDYPIVVALALVNQKPWITLRIVNSFIDEHSTASPDPAESETVFRFLFYHICLTPRIHFARTCSGPDRSLELAHILRANALRSLYREGEAIDELRKDIEFYPEDAEFYFLVSVLLDELGDQSKTEEAIVDLDKAIALDSSQPLFYQQMCDEAIVEYRKAVDPREAQRLFLRGNALYDQSKHEEATDEYLKAAALDPNIVLDEKSKHDDSEEAKWRRDLGNALYALYAQNAQNAQKNDKKISTGDC
jgi:tetratricopeptide (TPR) repeat protein